jgi:hypothetical protein
VLAPRPRSRPISRGDVERGLGEQPERDDPKYDPEEQTIVAAERLGLGCY